MGTADGCNSELNSAWGFVKHQTGVHYEVENEVLFVLVGPVKFSKSAQFYVSCST